MPHKVDLRPDLRPMPDRQRGISLLEVLVAIVVLSLGILGVSSLQITGLKNSYSAHMRAQAAQYAYDLGDRMRANRQAAVDGEYVIDKDDPAPAACDTLAHCDLKEWLAQVAGLPSGDGEVVAGDGKVTIKLYWSEEAVGPDPNPLAEAKLSMEFVL